MYSIINFRYCFFTQHPPLILKSSFLPFAITTSSRFAPGFNWMLQRSRSGARWQNHASRLMWMRVQPSISHHCAVKRGSRPTSTHQLPPTACLARSVIGSPEMRSVGRYFALFTTRTTTT